MIMAATHLERLQEAIAGAVLDAGEPISARVLAGRVGGSSRERTTALAQFLEENATGVGALHVAIERGAALPTGQQSEKPTTTDPRARIIRLTTSVPAAVGYAEVYGVFAAASSPPEGAARVMATALWEQERKLRNQLFDRVEKTKPLSRELKALYHSDVTCPEATSRTDLGDQQGEEAVSVFDSMRGASTGSKPKSSITSSSSSSVGASSSKGSFFKSSAQATTAKPKPSAVKQSAPATTSARQPSAEPKRVDAQTMNNVLTIDSDDDDSDDGGAPKFVKSVPAPAGRPRGKRVISDDEDEEDDIEPQKKAAAPPTKKQATAAPARSRSPEPSKAAPSLKRPRDAEQQEVDAPEPQAEDDTDTEPTGPIKRRVQVTKTRINEQGYMVTEQVWEEVEVSVEEQQREHQEAKKKRAAEAAAAEKRARAAAAAKSNSTNSSSSSKASKAGGAPKQKKLDFFFTRK
ncbi:hypothetical protein PINS_up005007 [Pythium insidiosum]|nr:hypothetical protein PINS_up005007 [Pythium insidiosum]